MASSLENEMLVANMNGRMLNEMGLDCVIILLFLATILVVFMNFR